MKKIILGVSGSIAAYKAADVANELTKKGYSVHVVMTQAGAALVTPNTFQALTKNRVFSHVMQEDDPSQIIHVDLPQKHCDLFLIAPATANVIAKIAGGIADDMLTSMVLATPPKVPKLIAPAMNTLMYENPATQENLKKLESRGWSVIEPREARLACGYVGKGALAEVGVIVKAAQYAAGE